MLFYTWVENRKKRNLFWSELNRCKTKKNDNLCRFMHGSRDSNSRHLVLETSALPTELDPYCGCKSSLIF